MNFCGACGFCCQFYGSSDRCAGERCRQLAYNGCKIHDTAPLDCRQFSCLWLAGRRFLSPRWRPDVLGVMFTITRSELELSGFPMVPNVVMLAVPRNFAAYDSTACSDAVQQVADLGLPVIVRVPSPFTQQVTRKRIIQSKTAVPGKLLKVILKRMRRIADEAVIADEVKKLLTPVSPCETCDYSDECGSGDDVCFDKLHWDRRKRS